MQGGNASVCLHVWAPLIAGCVHSMTRVCKAQQCESTLPRTPGVQKHEAKLRRNYFMEREEFSKNTGLTITPHVYSTPLSSYSPSQLTCCWRSTQHRARGREAMQSAHRAAGSSEGCMWLRTEGCMWFKMEGCMWFRMEGQKSGRQRRVNDWLQVQRK